MNNKVDEYKLLNDTEYRETWIEDELKASTEYFLDSLGIKDYMVCDCERNYGKACKYPEKYKDGGCK